MSKATLKEEDVKVNLKLLKQFVESLENSLAIADLKLGDKSEEQLREYTIEMSKATGLAAGILQEATLLMSDIQSVLKLKSGPSFSSSKEDMFGGYSSLADVFGPKKSSGKN
jgi:hypothetical protein